MVSGPLDDPMALPGQVIVAGAHPGYLKYNGGGPVFLSGPDNPEDFLFRGTLNPDGARSGDEIIGRECRHALRPAFISVLALILSSHAINHVCDNGDILPSDE